jgi:hypothetical protein
MPISVTQNLSEKQGDTSPAKKSGIHFACRFSPAFWSTGGHKHRKSVGQSKPSSGRSGSSEHPAPASPGQEG